MRVTGACHCGQITYEAEIDPARVGICNCTDCQVLTGSAFRVSVPAPAPAFRLLSGTPKVYVKTADSGARRRHSFCPNCGTPVAASADSDDPPSYSLRVGCLAQKAQLPPKRRIWCKSALPWSQDVSMIPGIDGRAAAEPPPPGAMKIIARVNRAAKDKDYVALRADMAREFTWSFGGDSSAEQAIDEWKKEPRYMLQLGRVTRAKCAYRKDKYVECPANAGASFRAGFKLSGGQWKMVYFVEGD